AHARLIETVMGVIAEISSLAVRWVLVAWPMQVRHARDIFSKYRGQRDRHRICFQMRECVVAHVEIPQRLKDTLPTPLPSRCGALWPPSEIGRAPQPHARH